jgi:hypothetical protein
MSQLYDVPLGITIDAICLIPVGATIAFSLRDRCQSAGRDEEVGNEATLTAVLGRRSRGYCRPLIQSGSRARWRAMKGMEKLM